LGLADGGKDRWIDEERSVGKTRMGFVEPIRREVG